MLLLLSLLLLPTTEVTIGLCNCIPRQEDVHAALNHLFVSFLFVFQNDNDLIDNDNAGQSPAAQAVVLKLFSYLLSSYTLVSFSRFRSLFYFPRSPFFR